MKKTLQKCILLILLITGSSLYAQDLRISGTVRGDDGPIPGVSITLKNGNNGVATDANGVFSIIVPQDGILTFKAIGYKTLEEVINRRNVINISLESETGTLDEVVVVGYGTQAKRDITGAISSVKGSDLVMSTSPDIGHLLKGKAAGLMVIENSAQPGGGLNIQIRGAGSINASNAPLVVVDGFPIADVEQIENGGRYKSGSQSILNSFNPNDIESIEVLKDASATAIYGSRAANGVILITTKKGKEGKAIVQYTENSAFQKYNNSYDVFPLNEWMEQKNKTTYESWLHSNNVIPYGTRTLEEAIANPASGFDYVQDYTLDEIKNAGRGTDWLDLVTRNGSIQQHNLSLSGGSNATRFLLSGNYYEHQGVVKKSGMDRYSFRANIDQDISKYVKLGLNLTASRINNTNSQLGDGQYENSGLIRSAIEMGPHILAIDANGNYPLNPENAMRPNPYSLLTVTDKGKLERMLFNSFVDIKPINDLTIRLKAGMDWAFSKRSIYQPKTTLFGNLEQGIASLAERDNDSYLYEGTIDYRKTFASAHKFNFLVGASKQKFYAAYNSMGNTGFIMDSFLWNNMGSGSGTKSVGSSGSENLMASYFSRLNYVFNEKYLVTFTVRTDGSSVFSKNNKWATFPSVALGWNIDNENWFNIAAVSQLKLRLSYGKTGNASIGTNAFAAYSAYPAYLSGDDAITTGVSLSRLENPDLKWETTTGRNFGIDFGFFNDRVSGSLEIYKNGISDLLNYKPLNSYNVVNVVMANIGKTQSKGVELSITTRNVERGDFSWKTMFSASKFKDNWVERAENWAPAIYERDKDPIRAIYSYVSEGIMQTGEERPIAQPILEPGQVKIKDLNGYKRDKNGNPIVDANNRFVLLGAADGIIDEADTKLIGTRDPSLIAGFTNIINYKKFSLNLDFNGLFGRKIRDPNYVAFGVSAEGRINRGLNALRIINDRWTPTNPSTTQPSGFSTLEGYGDFFYQNAWFIRLQNLSLGYELPKEVTGKLFNTVRLNIGANNLFVITPYNGIDPETDSYTAAYPNVKTFTAGLSVIF